MSLPLGDSTLDAAMCDLRELAQLSAGLLEL
jgi:hypothetical protein